MEFTALGGGDSIGASCYVLKLAGKTIVVDCGLKFVFDRQVRPPAIHKIGNRNVDLFLLTHAHLDHMGAAPRLASQHPEAKIMATAPTVDIGEMMMADTIKIAQRRNVTPMFSWEDYGAFMRRVKSVESAEWFSLWPDWQICFWPAGHMRGAASILIKSPEADVMFSGDISFNDTPVVKGALMARDFNPYLLVTETTNGDQELPNRADEISRLVAKIREVHNRGGHVLIPAFASERGPNLALDLANAGLQVLTGGMVNDVLRICHESRWCCNDNEVPKTHSNIKRIPKGLNHQDIITNNWDEAQPTVVITTSGMMDFGLSRTFAYAWLENPKNAVLVPGYQAEDAFGRRLIGVNRGDFIEFPEMLGQKQRQVLAEIGRFHLSGHGSSSQMAAWIRALDPMMVAMVHGERDSFQALKQRLRTEGLKSRIVVGHNRKKIKD